MRAARGLATAVVAASFLAGCSSSAAGPRTQPGQAIEAQGARGGGFTDPDDVNLALDLKTLTHTADASTVTYTVETYEPFKDDQVDFTWGIDKNNDGAVDNNLSVEFEEGKLEGKFEDPKEKELGNATVTRTGPSSLEVSLSRRLLGSASAYQYRVTALTDQNGNDEEDAGETDLAPDNGFQPHQL